MTAPSAKQSRVSDLTLLRVWWALVVVVWAALTITTTTMSSMGSYASPPAIDSGVVFAQAQPLRSDEYARVTPLMLGLQAAGDTSFLTPLTNDPFITSSIPPGALTLETLVFPEMGAQALGSFLPDGPLFAFGFWFMPAIVVMLMPYLLMAWGARFWVALAGTLLFSFTPVVAWWSLRPFQAVFAGVVAASCWVLASRLPATGRRWLAGAGLAVLGGVALARVPWSYPPWSLPLSGAVVLLTMIYLIRSWASGRRVLGLVALSGVVAGGVTLLIITFNEAAFAALNSTVYPGERRASGEFVQLGRSFGAPFDGIFATSPTYLVDNPTEWSGSWTFAVIGWLALVLAGWRAADRAGRIRSLLIGLLLAGGFSWFLVDWPVEVGSAVPGLSLIPPTRLAAIWGLVVVLAVVPMIGARVPWMPLVAAATATAVLLLAAGRDLSATLVPALTNETILAVTAIATAVTVLVLLGRGWSVAVGLMGGLVAAALTVYHVNPLQVGLEPLRSSPAAAEILADAGDRDPADGLWAADSPALMSLLTANGVPALSGEQWSGPSQRWSALDPDGEYEEAWNRAVSKVAFEWAPGEVEPVIGAPYPDEIRIRVDPCSPALDSFEVYRVVSSTELTGTCLTEVGRGVWNATPFFVYQREMADA